MDLCSVIFVMDLCCVIYRETLFAGNRQKMFWKSLIGKFVLMVKTTNLVTSVI